MGKVIILRGLPGSGKSSYAQRLAREVQQDLYATVVSADNFMMEAGEYVFRPEKLTLAHRSCWRKFWEYLSGSCSVVIVDNTNLRAVEVAPYVLPAEAMGWGVEIHTLDTVTPEEAFQRNVHGVPLEQILRMDRILREEKLPPWWKNLTLTSFEAV